MSTIAEPETTTAESADVPATEKPEEIPAWQMTLGVDVHDVGPCKKHVRVKVPEGDIKHIRDFVLDDMKSKAAVPGFRPGKAPRDVVAKRFGRELADELKQKVLIGSLEQLSMDTKIEPINEPDLDVENLTIPDFGEFEDGEIVDFDKLLTGARAGDTRTATVTISREAENIAMRGEKVQMQIEVLAVSRVKLPELNRALFQRVNVESLDELRIAVEQN